MVKINPKTGSLKGVMGPYSIYPSDDGNIIRPAHNISHHDRKSAGQMAQRQKVTLATDFLSPIKEFLKISFKTADGKNAYNRASSYLHKNAFTIIDEIPTINFQKVLVCQGLLAPPEGATLQFSNGTFTFAWTDNSVNAAANANDQLVFLIYNPTSKQFYSSLSCESTSTRENGRFDFTPKSVIHGDLHIYMAFRNADDTDISNSVHLGMVTI